MPAKKEKTAKVKNVQKKPALVTVKKNPTYKDLERIVRNVRLQRDEALKRQQLMEKALLKQEGKINDIKARATQTAKASAMREVKAEFTREIDRLRAELDSVERYRDRLKAVIVHNACVISDLSGAVARNKEETLIRLRGQFIPPKVNR